MTLDEYAHVVGNVLVHAHNTKDMRAVAVTFRDADQVLANSGITGADLKKFWEDVREIVVHSDRLLFEKQSNSALIALMQAIQREIAARTGAQAGKRK